MAKKWTHEMLQQACSSLKETFGEVRVSELKRPTAAQLGEAADLMISNLEKQNAPWIPKKNGIVFYLRFLCYFKTSAASEGQWHEIRVDVYHAARVVGLITIETQVLMLETVLLQSTDLKDD